MNSINIFFSFGTQVTTTEPIEELNANDAIGSVDACNNQL
jgi:hypothetical protein